MRGVSVRMMEEGGNYVHDWGLFFSFYVMPSNSVCRRLGGLGLSIVCVSPYKSDCTTYRMAGGKLHDYS